MFHCQNPELWAARRRRPGDAQRDRPADDGGDR